MQRNGHGGVTRPSLLHGWMRNEKLDHGAVDNDPMRRMTNRVDEASPRITVATAVLLVATLGLVDYATGPEMAFSIFYLLPVSLVGWKCGSSWHAMGVAGAAAAVWLLADLVAGQHYAHEWVAMWNSATRFAVFVIVVRLLANLRHALEAQTKLAMLDPLTDVLNGRSFNSAATTAVAEAIARRHPFTVAYIDLDDFKSINGRLGHAGGDDALQLVGAALRDHVRSTDIVGRLGGDEFGIFFPQMGSDAAKTAMDGLLDRVHRAVAHLPLDVRFSAGAATFLVPPRDLDEVIRTADALMYQAKSAGKNGYVHVVVGEGSEDAVRDYTPPRPNSPS